MDGCRCGGSVKRQERLAPVAVIGTDGGTDDDGILGQMDGKDDHGRTD